MDYFGVIYRLGDTNLPVDFVELDGDIFAFEAISGTAVAALI